MSRGAAVAALSSLASEQWGMVTTAQGRRIGVSLVDISRLAADGTLERVDGAARVYRLTGVPEDPELDGIRAAWLQLGGSQTWEERVRAGDAIVSHRSAAHVRGLGDLIPRVHEFYVPYRRRPRRDDMKLRISQQIQAVDWNLSGGLPVCTAQRIISDLLADLEDESAIAQISRDAVRDGLVSRDDLREAAQGHASAYGHGSAEELADVLLGTWG